MTARGRNDVDIDVTSGCPWQERFCEENVPKGENGLI